jgi:hypothetical protein
MKPFYCLDYGNEYDTKLELFFSEVAFTLITNLNSTGIGIFEGQ